MYVTLYDGNVHPGVNMLLGMGKLVGSGDQQALVAARCELEEWARNASNRIVQLVNEVRLWCLTIPIERHGLTHYVQCIEGASE